MASVVRAMGGGSLLSLSKTTTRESGSERGHQSTSSLDSNTATAGGGTSNHSSSLNQQQINSSMMANDLNRKLSPIRVTGILLNSNRNPSPITQSPPSSPPASPLNPLYSSTSSSSSPIPSTSTTSNQQNSSHRSISTPVGQHLTYNNSDSISKIISSDPIASTSTSTSTSSVPFPSTETRGRSLSRPQLHSNPSTSTTATTATTNRSIRFAPLPEIRPRSYSTGRNIWLEDADVTEESGGPRKYIRRESLEQRGYEEEIALADEEEEDNRGRGGGGKSRGSRSDNEESPGRLSLGRFGSWGSSDSSSGGGGGGMMKSSGLSQSSTSNSHEDHHNSGSTSSGAGYSSLLGPLTFGLVKPKKSKKKGDSGASNTSNQSDSNARRDVSLSRVSSNESDLSRRSNDNISSSYNNSSHLANRKPTGIPLRKSRTWELGETQQQSRRAMYPPVAQRSKQKPVIVAIKKPEPKFVEWGYSKAGAGGGGLGSVRKAGYVDEVDADDGSGMAWVKRRKEEKKKKAEEEAAAAVAEAEKKRLSELETPEVVIGADGENNEMERLEMNPQLTLTGPSTTNSGTTTPSAKSMSLSSKPALHLYTADLEIISSTSSEPNTTITTTSKVEETIVASALPKIFTHAASPSSSSTPSPTTTTNSSTDLSSSDEHHQISVPSTSSTAITSARTKGLASFNPNRLSVDSFEMPRNVLTDGEDDDEDDNEAEGENEEDSDLDEDELAEEEMLAEKARVTALGAGAERYHSNKHESVLRKVETTSTSKAPKVACPKP